MKVRKWTKWFTEQVQTKAKADKAYQDAYTAATKTQAAKEIVTTDKIPSGGQRISDQVRRNTNGV